MSLFALFDSKAYWQLCLAHPRRLVELCMWSCLGRAVGADSPLYGLGQPVEVENWLCSGRHKYNHRDLLTSDNVVPKHQNYGRVADRALWCGQCHYRLTDGEDDCATSMLWDGSHLKAEVAAEMAATLKITVLYTILWLAGCGKRSVYYQHKVKREQFWNNCSWLFGS